MFAGQLPAVFCRTAIQILQISSGIYTLMFFSIMADTNASNPRLARKRRGAISCGQPSRTTPHDSRDGTVLQGVQPIPQINGVADKLFSAQLMFEFTSKFEYIRKYALEAQPRIQRILKWLEDLD